MDSTAFYSGNGAIINSSFYSDVEQHSAISAGLRVPNIATL